MFEFHCSREEIVSLLARDGVHLCIVVSGAGFGTGLFKGPREAHQHVSVKLLLAQGLGVNTKSKLVVVQLAKATCKESHFELSVLWDAVQSGLPIDGSAVVKHVPCEGAVAVDVIVTLPVRVVNVEDLKCAHILSGQGGVTALHG